MITPGILPISDEALAVIARLRQPAAMSSQMPPPLVYPPEIVAAALKRIGARIGAEHVLTAPADQAPYLTEGRGLFRGVTPAVLRPGNREDVAFCVATCAKAGLAMVPQGGNTGLVGAQVPLGSLVIALERLDRIRDLDPVDLTLTAEAGCTLQAVQEAAYAANALFPLSIGSQGSCRIGGNLASNAGGAAVLRYGTMRDLTLGLEVVLPDGRIWHGLSRLRKDNTGYDLKQLFIGSEGTLGIITAAVLRLFPQPRQRVTVLAGAPDPTRVLALFARLRGEAAEALTGFEMIPRFGMEIVLRHIAGSVRVLPGDHAWYVLAELTSARARDDLKSLAEDMLARALDSGEINDAVIAASLAQTQALWRLRESLSDAQKFEGGSIKHDVSVPVSRVADFVEAASRRCEAAMPGVRVCAFGHVGDGNIHFNLSQPVDMRKADFLASWDAFNRLVHDLVTDYEGSISAEHGIGLVKREELARTKDPAALDLMARIKAAVDPRGVINPGKMLERDL